MLQFVNFVGSIIKQGEKAQNDPSDLKDTDIRTIITGYKFLPKQFKSQEVIDVYIILKNQFIERGLSELPGFDL